MNQAITKLIDQGAIFYVGHSGGKDSQAMYAYIAKHVPSSQIRVIHADLGDIEHAGVKQHILDNISHPLMIAQARDIKGNDVGLFDMIRNRRKALDAKGKPEAPAFPSSAARFCTSDLKTGPIWREIRQEGHPLVVNCVGIRGQESPARQKKIDQRGTLNINKKNTNSKREAYDWWPIADWNIEQVWHEIVNVADQLPHPAYDLDYKVRGNGFDFIAYDFVVRGNERLSCMFCIFGSVNDLRNARNQNPELYHRYIDLEIEVRGTMFHTQSLAEKINRC